MKTFTVLSLALLTLCACGKSQDESEAPAANATAPAPTPSAAPAAAPAQPVAAPAIATSATPLPPYPKWAVKLIGGDTSTGYTVGGQCLGAFDAFTVRHTAEPAGVEARGWGWLTVEKAAPTKILFVDQAGGIVGAGETTTMRPDVTAGVPAVTTQKVGWHGEIAASSGELQAMALMSGRRLCLLGSKSL